MRAGRQRSGSVVDTTNIPVPSGPSLGMVLMPSSMETAEAEPRARARSILGSAFRHAFARGAIRRTAPAAAFVAAAVGATAAASDGTPAGGDAANGGAYASVEASISPDGAAAATHPALPVPLARSDASGALVARTGRPIPSTRDCRWPDERTLAAILPVVTDRGSHASGVVFAAGRVLTAAHAIADGGRFFVRVDDRYRAADLLLLDVASDVAVLGVDTHGIVPLSIADRDPIARQPVWAVGFPREAGRTTSSGVFQRNREGALHASAPIDSGQSGGGLLACERGEFRVLGMLRGFGAYREGDVYVKLDNHSVSVAGATIHRVLAGR